MSSEAQTENLDSLVNQFLKSFEEIKKNINNIQNRDTSNLVRENYNVLLTNAQKIEKILEAGNDSNEAIQYQYLEPSKEFNEKKNDWESILKQKEAEFSQALQDQERLNNIDSIIQDAKAEMKEGEKEMQKS